MLLPWGFCKMFHQVVTTVYNYQEATYVDRENAIIGVKCYCPGVSAKCSIKPHNVFIGKKMILSCQIIQNEVNLHILMD